MRVILSCAALVLVLVACDETNEIVLPAADLGPSALVVLHPGATVVSTGSRPGPVQLLVANGAGIGVANVAVTSSLARLVGPGESEQVEFQVRYSSNQGAVSFWPEPLESAGDYELVLEIATLDIAPVRLLISAFEEPSEDPPFVEPEVAARLGFSNQLQSLYVRPRLQVNAGQLYAFTTVRCVIASIPDGEHMTFVYDVPIPGGGYLLDGNLLYSTSRTDLYVHDLSTLPNSELLFKLPYPRNPYQTFSAIALRNDFLYLGDATTYSSVHAPMSILDHTSSVPVFVSPQPFGVLGFDDLVIKDDLLLAARGVSGVEIYGLLDPSRPELESHLGTLGDAHRLLLDGDLLWVLNTDCSVMCLDVSSPESPVYVSHVASPVDCSMRDDLGPVDMIRVGDYLFHTNTYGYSNSGDGIRVYDVSSVDTPALVGVARVPAPHAMAFGNGVLYVLDSTGLSALRFADLMPAP